MDGWMWSNYIRLKLVLNWSEWRWTKYWAALTLKILHVTMISWGSLCNNQSGLSAPSAGCIRYPSAGLISVFVCFFIFNCFTIGKWFLYFFFFRGVPAGVSAAVSSCLAPCAATGTRWKDRRGWHSGAPQWNRNSLQLSAALALDDLFTANNPSPEALSCLTHQDGFSFLFYLSNTMIAHIRYLIWVN